MSIEITGTITLADGSPSQFSITADLGWQQWGAIESRLYESVALIEAMTTGLAEAGLLLDDEEKPMYCDGCGKHGTVDDLCFIGEECPDEDCNGTIQEYEGKQ